MRPKARRVGDKEETSINSCSPRHPEWDASSETKAKSCGPGMQPFERSKNRIGKPVWGKREYLWHRESDFLLGTMSFCAKNHFYSLVIQHLATHSNTQQRNAPKP